MAQAPLSREQAEATLRAVEAAGGNQVHAARALGVSSNSIASRLRVIRDKFPNMHVPEPAKGGQRPAQPRSLTEDAVLHRATREAAASKAKLKEALSEMAALQDQIRDLKWGAGAMAAFTPAPWTLPARRLAKSEHTPYLITSDFQVGEVVRKEETEHGYGYDVDTFKRRYRRMIETTIDLARRHVGPDWTYPGIIYARAGDPISGGIHQELRETDSLSPPEAARVCAETETGGILMLAEEFGKVSVPCVGHSNHSRITLKPQAKRARQNSYDSLIDWMIMDKLRGDKRVTFQVSESPDVFFPIYEMNILLTHGDNMGSRGGTGFIGPLATIMRGAQKVIAEQATLGRRVDRVDHGHFHTPAYIGWVLSNGSMPGYSEYAKMFRMRPSPPTQMLAFHHPKRGLVDLKPLILTEA